MFLKKRLKAGILLYALIMVSLFALFLQFYSSRLEANQKKLTEMRQSQTAYFIAYLARENVSKQIPSGQLQCDKGSCAYQVKDKKIHVRVILKTGQTYSYVLPMHSEK